MGKPDEDPIGPELDITQIDAHKKPTCVPTYCTLEEILPLGPDLDNLEIGRRGMPFAAAYLGFWETRKACLEAIQKAKDGTTTPSIVQTAKARAKNRFIAIHKEIPPAALETTNNFWGFMFLTAFHNGLKLCENWAKTTQGQTALTLDAFLSKLETSLT